MNFKHINKPTSAKYIKAGAAILAASQFMNTYSINTPNTVVQYIGLALGVIGTLIVTFND